MNEDTINTLIRVYEKDKEDGLYLIESVTLAKEDLMEIIITLHRRLEALKSIERNVQNAREFEFKRFQKLKEEADYVLQERLHNKLNPRVIDIAYTAWSIGRSGKNEDDGGPCDWFNDTKPTIDKLIEQTRKVLDL